MSVSKFYSIYMAMCVSVEKVLSMIESGTEPQNISEEHILGYLKQYIGNLNRIDLQSFLRFVTGLCVCTGQGLKIAFNKLDGLV